MPNRKRSPEAATAARELDFAQVVHPLFTAKMALFGVQMMQANLAAVRAVFDAWRAAVRTQQDALLDSLDTQVHEAAAVDESDLAMGAANADGRAYPAPHDANGKARDGALDAFA